jgi:type IV secretory pathway TrbL component
MLWIVLKIGVFSFLLNSLFDLMWNGAFTTFLRWGAATSQGAFTEHTLLNPGTILISGFKVAAPLKFWIDRFIGVTLPLYFIDTTVMLIAYWFIILAFGFIATAMMMAIIEFKFALSTGGVLIPWAVLTPEFAVYRHLRTRNPCIDGASLPKRLTIHRYMHRRRELAITPMA